ncbi:MAG: hypothetical protein HY587_04765 [Candidatus Omnitrophica bacterium]|nr:hypothetical protein [Candidatus Omnitrophota bacterium]
MFGNLASQVIAQAFVLPFQLLPLAIKYAPLALLFIEKSEPDGTFYVEWLGSDIPPIEIDQFVDRHGREISVLKLPAQVLNLDAVRLNLSRGIEKSNLLLTANEFKTVSPDDLRETWEILKTRPGTVWVAGKLAADIRRESLIAYV